MEPLRSYWPQDDGPIYMETPLVLEHGQWLIEPWNAFSSLLIILPGLFFLFRLRGAWQGNFLLALCAPVLILGGLGSTLFHGLRSSAWFLMMDVYPTMLVFLILTIYLWWKALGNIWLAVGVIFAELALSVVAFRYLPAGVGVNVAYLLRGTTFFLPLLILLFRTQFYQAWRILLGLLFFFAALVFRLVDLEPGHGLPMGTHFLWHACTGVGGLLVAEYLFRLNPPRPRAAAGVS